MIISNPTRSIRILGDMQSRFNEYNNLVGKLLSSDTLSDKEKCDVLSNYIITVERYNAWYFGACQTKNPDTFEVIEKNEVEAQKVDPFSSE